MRPKCLVVGVAALNLVAGFSFGFTAGRTSLAGPGDRTFECRVVQDAVHDPDFPKLADSIGLAPEKAAKVRAVLTSCGPRCDAVLDEARPKMRALHEQILGELSAALTHDELERLEGEFHKRYGEFEHATPASPH